MQYITLTYPQTASLHIQGYMFNQVYKVFLSSGNITFPSLTSINIFSNNHTVSAFCPAFSGYEYPPNLYSLIDKNNLYLSLTSFTPTVGLTGIADIILFNNAGYTKLSDHNFLIQYRK